MYIRKFLANSAYLFVYFVHGAFCRVIAIRSMNYISLRNLCNDTLHFQGLQKLCEKLQKLNQGMIRSFLPPLALYSLYNYKLRDEKRMGERGKRSDRRIKRRIERGEGREERREKRWEKKRRRRE